MNTRGRTMQWIAFGLLVIPAIIRVLVFVSPNLYFATDPRLLPFAPDGLGPAGAIALDVLSLLGAALALLAQRLAGRRIDRTVCLLAVLPVIALVVHAPDSLGDLRIGSHWLAGMATAVGAFHLARTSILRVMMISAVMSLVVPLAVKGGYQVTVGHQVKIDQFEQNADAILAARGAAPGSTGALLYERRVRQREATGWFVTSNIYGSIMAGLTAFWVAVAVTAARTRMSSGWIGLIGLVTAAGMLWTAVSFSKGAIGLAVVGICLAGITLAPRPWRRRLSRRAGWIGLGMIGGAIGFTVLRGALLGEAFTLDGYSLLFRWHYWIGAARIWWHHPLFGVGPDGFQSAYLLYKPPISPEEVALPHNAFLGWLATLGVFGLPWAILVIRLLMGAAPERSDRSSAGDVAPNETLREDGPGHLDAADPEAVSAYADGDRSIESILDRRCVWWAAGAVGIVGLGTAWVVSPAMEIDMKWLLWPLAVLGYIALVGVLPWFARHATWPLLRWGVFAALAVMITHSQIEMTLTQPGSASIIMLLLGAAGAGRVGRVGRHAGRGAGDARVQSAPAHRTDIPGWLIVAGAFLIWVVHAVCVYVPVAGQQRMLGEAAATLAPIGDISLQLRSAVAQREMTDLIDGLSETGLALGAAGFDPHVGGMLREAGSALQLGDSQRVNSLLDQAYRSITSARTDLADAIIPQAIELLDGAAKRTLLIARTWRLPNDVTPQRELAKLHLAVAFARHETGLESERDLALDRADEAAQRVIEQLPDRAGSYSFAARIHFERWRIVSELRIIEQVVRLQERAVALDPYGLSNTEQLAGFFESREQPGDAARWYRRLLELDDQLRLDPLKGLGDRRPAIEAKIATLGP